MLIELSGCLKVPESYEKYLRVISSVKGKSLSISPRRREWATSQTANVEGHKDSSLPNSNDLIG